MIENRHLLDAVLSPPSDGANDVFDPLLERTLTEVRRQRTRRRRRSFAIRVAAVAAVAGLAVFQWLPKPMPAPSAVSEHLATRPLADRDRLVTARDSIPTRTSSMDGLQIIGTEATTEVPPIISDEDLLSLARDEPGALVRRDGGKAEFVFLAARHGAAGEGLSSSRTWTTR